MQLNQHDLTDDRCLQLRSAPLLLATGVVELTLFTNRCYSWHPADGKHVGQDNQPRLSINMSAACGGDHGRLVVVVANHAFLRWCSRKTSFRQWRRVSERSSHGWRRDAEALIVQVFYLLCCKNTEGRILCRYHPLSYQARRAERPKRLPARYNDVAAAVG